MSVKPIVSCKTTVALLIFSPSGWSVHLCKWGIKIPYYYCNIVNFCSYDYQYLLYVFRCSYIWCTYVNECKPSSCIDPFVIIQCASLPFVIAFVLKPILSDMSIATPALFSFHFSWNIFNALTFSLCVSLGLKWVSRWEHIEWSCLAIQ